MVIFPPRLVTFPGCLTHTRHHYIKLLFFKIILLLGQEHRWYVRKYFYNSGCNAFHRAHNQNFNIYDQSRDKCTAILKKFADMEEICKSEQSMHGDRSRIIFPLYWHVVPMRQWKLESWVWKQNLPKHDWRSMGFVKRIVWGFRVAYFIL